MPKRILITGGAGFIGSHRADELLSAPDRWLVQDAERTLERLDAHGNAAARRELQRVPCAS